MTWQDAAFTFAQAMFAIALLPTVFSPTEKPHRLTCFLTGSCLILMTSSFASLHLDWSALSAGVCASLWFVLLVQTRKADGMRYVK